MWLFSRVWSVKNVWKDDDDTGGKNLKRHVSSGLWQKTYAYEAFLRAFIGLVGVQN